MATEILGGTQIISSGTQVVGDKTSGNGATFTGGLLRKGENISGWVIDSKIPVQSGEADIYVAFKDGKKGVVKYYRGNIHPKDGLLENLVDLNHPDIINVYEYGNFNNHFYEIMEFAEGGSLDSRDENGDYALLPLSEEQVFQVCKEVVNSFKTIHEKGIIHRDIKPANIYYRDKARTDVVIGDFGISSLMNENGEGVSHKTQTASRTTGYAAPEVLSGIISAKMDYYALGITLWELATGKDPFVMPNGKRRNDAHLIRDTIEGRIADDLLSREPFLSERLQHLIRGLLVIDDKLRWGYEEVTRFLKGENVPVAQKKVKDWSFSIGNVSCTTLEAIGVAIAQNPEAAKKTIYHGSLSGFLEDKYPDIVKKMDDIIEETSANNQYKVGIAKIIWLLKPDYPFEIDGKYKAENIEDIINFLINAPEKMIPILEDDESSFYPYIEHLGYGDKLEEIKEIAGQLNKLRGWKLMEKVYHVAIILKDKVIKPFKLERYKDFELSELSQLDRVPSDLRDYVINLIKTKCFDGLLFPWITLMAGKGIDWDKFNKWDDIKNIHSKETYIVVSQNGEGDYKTITEAYNFAKDGCVIDIRKGNYNESLNIEKEVEITCSDGSYPVIELNYGENWTVSSSNVKISNIYFMGLNTEVEFSDDEDKALLILNKECTLDNCKFNRKALYGSDIYAYAGSNILNCFFSDDGAAEESYTKACIKLGPGDFTIKGCTFENSPYTCISKIFEDIDVRNEKFSWTVDECKFLDLDSGIHIDTFEDTEWLASNKILLTVTGCTFNDVAICVNIHFYDTTGSVELLLKDSSFSKCDDCALYLGNPVNNISNCNFIDCDFEVIGIDNTDAKEIKEFNILDCTFKNSPGAADSSRCIGIYNSKGLIKNCHIDGSNGNGILSYDGDVTIEKCDIAYCGVDGIQVEKGNYIVRDCNITSCGGHGIMTKDGGEISIENCNIKTCEKDGILYTVDADFFGDSSSSESNNVDNNVNKSLKCKNCVIESNNARGFNLCVKNFYATLEDTVIKHNKSEGIFIGNNKVDIINCEILENQDGGVYSIDSESKISECKIYNNSYNNLRLSGNSKTSLDNCSIYGSNAINVYSWDSANGYFENCNISDGNLSNIEIKENSNFTLKNCKIDKSTGDGISVLDNASLDISGCEISNCRKFGILKGKQAKVSKNSCTFSNNNGNIVTNKKL